MAASGEHLLLEAGTKRRLVNTVTEREELVCVIVICKVCGTVRVESSLAIQGYKRSINPITNLTLSVVTRLTNNMIIHRSVQHINCLRFNYHPVCVYLFSAYLKISA